jgi:hypothetical protein
MGLLAPDIIGVVCHPDDTQKYSMDSGELGLVLPARRETGRNIFLIFLPSLGSELVIP